MAPIEKNMARPKKKKTWKNYLTKKGREARKWEKVRNKRLTRFMEETFRGIVADTGIIEDLTPEEMYEKAQHLVIPNNAGVNNFYTLKEGRSPNATVDNIHVAKKTKKERLKQKAEQDELMKQINKLESEGASLRKIKKLEEQLDNTVIPFSENEMKIELRKFKRYISGKGTLSEVSDEVKTFSSEINELKRLGVYTPETGTKLYKNIFSAYKEMNQAGGIRAYRDGQTKKTDELIDKTHKKLHNTDDILAVVHKRYATNYNMALLFKTAKLKQGYAGVLEDPKVLNSFKERFKQAKYYKTRNITQIEGKNGLEAVETPTDVSDDLNRKEMRLRLETLLKSRNTLIRFKNYLRGVNLIKVDRNVANHHDVDAKVRGYFTEDYSRIAGAFASNYFDTAKKDQNPTSKFIDAPEWAKPMVLSDPHGQTGYILGSDYAGEPKKWTMRKEQDNWGDEGKGVGLHCGVKTGTFIELINPKNEALQKEFNESLKNKKAFDHFLSKYQGKNVWRTVKKTTAYIGLSGTGKTVHTVWSHFKSLFHPEGFEFVGDDQHVWEQGTKKKVKIRTRLKNGGWKNLLKTVYVPGRIFNMEDQYYMKAFDMPNKPDKKVYEKVVPLLNKGLTPKTILKKLIASGIDKSKIDRAIEYHTNFQRPILDAFYNNPKLVSGENLFVDKTGEFDLKNKSLTENSRFFIPRSLIKGSSSSPNAKSVDFMVILTRGKHYPPVLYVNDPKQAKTFYAAVESVKRAGTEVGITKDIPVRMVGANPFIAKLKHVFHLENFEECLRTNPQTKMLVVNTDHFGSKKSIKITPYDNFATWEGMGRPNSIEVEYDKLYGNYRGVSINGVPKELLDRHGLYAPGELEKINKEEIMPGRKAYFRRLLPGFKPKFKGKKTSDTHPFKLRKK